MERSGSRVFGICAGPRSHCATLTVHARARNYAYPAPRAEKTCTINSKLDAKQRLYLQLSYNLSHEDGSPVRHRRMQVVRRMARHYRQRTNHTSQSSPEPLSHWPMDKCIRSANGGAAVESAGRVAKKRHAPWP